MNPTPVPPNNSNLQPLLDKILASTYTLTDALRRVRTLRQFMLNQLFASAISSFASGNEADAAWLPSLGTDFFGAFNKDNVYTIFDDLEAEIKKIHPLTIYLPFEIPQGEVVRIGMKVRKDYGANFLLEFKINPELIAGCALVWGSTYKDYSVRAKIEDNKARVIDIIRSHLKQ